MIDRVKEVFAKYPKVVKLFGWSLLVFLIVVFTSIFFISFSLARHKRIVADLRAQVIAQKAKLQIAVSEKKLLQLRMTLLELKKKDEEHEKEREKLRGQITKAEVTVTKGKARLERELKKIKGKSLQQLLNESERLLKETL